MNNNERICYKEAVRESLPDLERIRCAVLAEEPVGRAYTRKRTLPRWLMPLAACVCALLLFCAGMPTVRAAILSWFQVIFSVPNYVAQPVGERERIPELEAISDAEFYPAQDMIVAEHPSEVEGKVPFLVGECVCHRSGKLGQGVACYPFVRIRCLGYRNLFGVVGVPHQPVAVIVDTGVAVCAVIADTLPLLDALQITGGVGGLHPHEIIEFLAHIFVVRETQEFVRVCGSDEVDRIFEILAPHCIPVQVDLHAAVSHGSDVDKGLIMDIRGRGDFIVAQKVLLCTVVIVDGTVYPVVQKREIEPYIPVSCLFPFKIRI